MRGLAATVGILTVQYIDPPQRKPSAQPRRWIESIGSGVIVDGIVAISSPTPL